MGKVGVEKTTLINILCGTEHPVDEAKESTTRDVSRDNFSCGNYAFSFRVSPPSEKHFRPKLDFSFLT